MICIVSDAKLQKYFHWRRTRNWCHKTKSHWTRNQDAHRCKELWNMAIFHKEKRTQNHFSNETLKSNVQKKALFGFWKHLGILSSKIRNCDQVCRAERPQRSVDSLLCYRRSEMFHKSGKIRWKKSRDSLITFRSSDGSVCTFEFQWSTKTLTYI